MAPIDRPALYVGKLLGILILLAAVEVLVVPLVALVFQAALFDYAGLMIGLLAAGTIGFAAVGTLFAAMLVRARSRDVLLPVLLYPITVPVIIAGELADRFGLGVMTAWYFVGLSALVAVSLRAARGLVESRADDRAADNAAFVVEPDLAELAATV